MKRFLGPVVAVIGVATGLLAFTGTPAEGVPRYSARYNRSCDLCHVNPTGGGMRALYGAQFFSYTDLAIKELPFDEIESVQPMLNDRVQVGADLRTTYFGSDEPAANTFMQMQGDLYVNFELSPEWGAYFDKGLYGGFEAFGVGHVLPSSGYIKAGRFYPPYGLRVADHNVFVRERMGFSQRLTESGMEIGFHPQVVSAAVAVTNGSTGFFDDDEAKAITGRTDVRFHVGELFLWLGGTGRYNASATQDDVHGGGYGGISLGRVTVLGEVVLRDFERQSLASFIEAAVLLTRGVTLKVEHDYFDPDRDFTSGAENMFLLGLEVVPTGFLQLISNIRYHDREPGDDPTTALIASDDYFEGEIQLHLFY